MKFITTSNPTTSRVPNVPGSYKDAETMETMNPWRIDISNLEHAQGLADMTGSRVHVIFFPGKMPFLHVASPPEETPKEGLESYLELAGVREPEISQDALDFAHALRAAALRSLFVEYAYPDFGAALEKYIEKSGPMSAYDDADLDRRGTEILESLQEEGASKDRVFSLLLRAMIRAMLHDRSLGKR